MIVRAWFFVVGVLVGAGAVSFYVMRNYDVRLVPTGQAPVIMPAQKSAPAPSVTPPAQARPAAVTPASSPVPAPSIPSAAPVPTAPTAVAPPSANTPTQSLLLPVQGIQPSELVDTFNQTRGGTRIHEALDIMAPRGREVVAVADGKVVKLFTSKQGGLTVYQFDPSERFSYYYAHLDRYAPGLVEGKLLKRGELVGYVGSTGNSSPDAPHLHFAIFELGPEKRWWEGRPINPYPLLRSATAPN